MARYAMAIDLDHCIGCYNCQIACKDEHVGNTFLPIAKPQPTFGHFWMGIKEVERCSSPSKIKVFYIPMLCQHCGDAPCMKAAKDGAIYRRADGIVIIDPQKAAGQKHLLKACPYGAIFWNEEEKIPQKCTFCAHLLDDGWKEPRCVQTCPTSCMYFGDLDDPVSRISRFLAVKKAEFLEVERGTKPVVQYVGLPKPQLAGTVILGDKDECGKGVRVTLNAKDGGQMETQTDFFGDFHFDNVEKAKYTIRVESGGYKSQSRKVDLTEEYLYVGEITLPPT